MLLGGVLLLLCLTACSEQFTDGDLLHDSPTELVAEGWVEADGHAVMYVTLSMQVSMAYSDYAVAERDYVVRTAEIDLLWRDRCRRMEGRPDTASAMPFAYFLDDMDVHPGDTVKMRMKCYGVTCEAVTTIPGGHPIDALRVEQVEGDDVYRLRLDTRGVGADERARVFVDMPDTLTGFLLAPMAGVNGSLLTDGKASVVVTRPAIQYEKGGKYFHKGESLTVRLSWMDSTSYAFWEDFEARLDLSRNPFLPLATNLQGNISRIKGCWCGYNSFVRTVTVE